MIYIYGASDDLVEVEGDIREEFSLPSENMLYLAFSNGLMCRIEYRGEWEMRLVSLPILPLVEYKLHPVGSEQATTLSKIDYTDVLVIDHDVEWILAGTELVKL